MPVPHSLQEAPLHKLLPSLTAAGVALGLAAVTAGKAQEPPIRFRLGAEATEVRPGGVLVLGVGARVPRGWHLYGMSQPPGGPLPTSVQVGPNPPFTLAAPVSASEPAGEFDGNFGLFVQWYADSARFRVPVRAARAALPGTYDVEVRISYQRCNDRICLPLTTDTLRAPLTIAGAPEPGAPESGMQAPGMRAPGASEASRPTGRSRESRAARDGGEPVGWTGGGSLAQAGTQARPAPGSPAITPAGATPRNLPGEQAGQVAGYLVLGAGIVVGLLLVLLILRWLALRRG